MLILQNWQLILKFDFYDISSIGNSLWLKKVAFLI